jgi:type VI secretion system secreted protein VgrG
MLHAFCGVMDASVDMNEVPESGAGLHEVDYEFVVNGTEETRDPQRATLWRPCAFELHEGIDDLWRCTIDLASTDLGLEPEGLVDQQAWFTMTRRSRTGEHVMRVLPGVIASVRPARQHYRSGATAVMQRARVELVPELWRLTQETDCRVFQNLDVLEIVRAVLDRASLYVGRRAELLRTARERRELCVQYRETSYDFMRRLLEDEGISFALRCDGAAEHLALIDTWIDHPTVARLRAEPLTVRDEGAATAGDESLHTLVWERRAPALPPVVEDYDFTHPHHAWSAPPRDAAARARGRIEYDYPAGLVWSRYGRADEAPATAIDRALRREAIEGDLDRAPPPDAAPEPVATALDRDLISRDTINSIPSEISYQANNLRAVAQARREEVLLRALTGHGESNVVGMAAGHSVAIDDFLPDGAAAPFLVTRVTHRGVMHEVIPVELREESAEAERYRNRFECVAMTRLTPDRREQPLSWRPRRVTERPRIHGAHSAVVSGDPNDASREVYLDEHGRIRVRFHWDGQRHGAPPDNGHSSCWVRVMQPWAGFGYGHLFVPRVGMEVVVNFLDGDPDRPVVMGSLYNAWNRPPTRNGGFGKLPRDATRSTLRTRSTPGGVGYNEISFEDAIGNEEVYLRAERDLREKVLRCHSTSVGADQSTSVGHDQTLAVGNDRTVTVTRSERTTVGDLWHTATDGHSNSVFLNKEGEFRATVTKRGEVAAGAEVLLRVGGNDVRADALVELLPRKATVAVGSACSAVLEPQRMKLTVGESAIEITPEKVVITSKAIELIAEESIDETSKGSIDLQGKRLNLHAAGADLRMRGGNIRASADKKVSLDATETVTLTGAEVKINDP